MDLLNPQLLVMSLRKCKIKPDRSVRRFDKNGNRTIQGVTTIVLRVFQKVFFEILLIKEPLPTSCCY